MPVGPAAPEHGAPSVVKAEARPDFSGVKKIIQRLQKDPQGPDLRITDKKPFPPEEFNEIDKVIASATEVHKKVTKDNPSYNSLTEMVGKNRKAIVVENADVSKPTEVSDAEGNVVINVPAEVYTLWQAHEDILMVRAITSSLKNGPTDTRAGDFVDSLKRAVDFTEANLPAETDTLEPGEPGAAPVDTTSIEALAAGANSKEPAVKTSSAEGNVSVLAKEKGRGSYTLIYDGEGEHTLAEVKDAVGEENLELIDQMVGKMLEDQKIRDLIDRKIENDPGKRFLDSPRSKEARRIVATELLNDVVMNSGEYRIEEPENPLLEFFDTNRTQVEEVDDALFSSALDYLNATEIDKYNEKIEKDFRSKKRPNRRNVQGEVANDLGTKGHEGEFESLMERPQMLDANGNLVEVKTPREYREYEMDRLIYQVIKRQVVDAKNLVRWEALKQGLLTSEGTLEEQKRIAINEQYKLDERIHRILGLDDVSRVDQDDRELYNRVDGVLQRFRQVKPDQFLSLATDPSRMHLMLSEEQRQEIAAELGLSGEDMSKVVTKVQEADVRRAGSPDGSKKGRIDDRYKDLAEPEDGQEPINFSPGLFRDRAFKIVDHVIRRRLFNPTPIKKIEKVPNKNFKQVTKKDGLGRPPRRTVIPGPRQVPGVGPTPTTPDGDGKPPNLTGAPVKTEIEEPPIGPPEPPEGGPTPPKVPPPDLDFSVAAVKQRLEHARANGSQVEDMEVLEERAREMARLRMTEDRERWGQRGAWIRQAIPRWWKYSLGDVATYNKEKQNAVRMLTESGVQMTTLPVEFLREVDVLARENIRNNRRGLGRVTGRVRDLAHEASFTQGDIQEQRIAVIRQLRQGFENPQDAANAQFLQQHPQLAEHYNHVMAGDFQAAESLATRLSQEPDIRDQIIHGVVGEQAGARQLEVSPELKQVISTGIIEPILRSGLAGNTIGPDGRVQIDPEVLKQARIQAQELFFRKEFVTWFDQMRQNPDPAIQAAANTFRESLSNGTDIIPMLQEVMLPQLLQFREHLNADNNLQEYINNTLKLKVNVGRLESGQKGVMNEGRMEQAGSRVITNERVMRVFQEIRNRNNGQGPNLVPDTYYDASVKRNQLLNQGLRVATNPFVPIAVAAGYYLARSGSSTAGKLVVPVIGGALVGGAFRAMQERRLYTREREQHGIENEIGYNFTPDMRRRRQMDRVVMHTREMQHELTDPMVAILRDVRGGTADNARIMQLMGLTADTQARINLGNTLEQGLLASLNPQSYQVEKTNLEITKADSMVALRNLLSGDAARFNAIKQTLGYNPNADVNTVMADLVRAQEEHLTAGAGLDARYQAALGNLTIQQEQSVNNREHAFTTSRRNRMIIRGATTAGFSALSIIGTRVGMEKLTQKLGWNKETTTVPGRDTAAELKAAYQNNGKVDIGNGVVVEAHTNNGIPGVATFSDGNGPINVGRVASIDNQGNLIFSGNTSDIHQALPTSIDQVVSGNGWQENGVTSPDYNLVEKFNDLARGNTRTEFQYGHTHFAIDPPGSGTNATPFTVIEARVSYDQLNPQTNQMVHIGGNPIYMGFDKNTHQLVFDPLNDGNKGRNILADAQALQQEWTKEGYKIPSQPQALPILGEQPIPQPDKVGSQDIMEYFDQKKMVVDAKRTYWHDNDTPFRATSRGFGVGADGKELQFYHSMVNQPNGEKAVQLDFSHMRSQLLPGTNRGVNWDNTVDSQYGRLVQDLQNGQYKNFQILIYPTDEAYEQGKAVAFDAATHPELVSGHLNFDMKAPETAAMFNLNAAGEPIRNEWGNFQKPAFIEVAHMDPTTGTRTILATTAGPGGHTSIPISIPQPALPPVPHNGFVIDPPKAVMFTPPAPDNVATTVAKGFGVGLPFTPYRTPLEEPEGKKGETPTPVRIRQEDRETTIPTPETPDGTQNEPEEDNNEEDDGTTPTTTTAPPVIPTQTEATPPIEPVVDPRRGVIDQRLGEIRNRRNELDQEMRGRTPTAPEQMELNNLDQEENLLNEEKRGLQEPPKGTFTIQGEKGYELEPVVLNEEEKFLRGVEIRGDSYNGERLTPEILKRDGLLPSKEVKIGDVVLELSAPYSLGSGRIAVVGYVNKNGHKVARTFYRSNSQGVWRFLPSYLPDGHGGISWYNKGFGEESVTLPIPLQQALAELSEDKAPLTVANPDLIFAGAARNMNDPARRNITFVREVEANPKKLEGNFYAPNRKDKMKPEDMIFTNPADAPNFDVVNSSWKQKTDQYGDIQVEVYESQNGQYQYMFCRDAKGRAWIGGVEDKTEVQSVGLRKNWVKAGDLTTPAYEYGVQAGAFGNPADVKGPYIDMFENYLSKIPVIQEYVRRKAA